MIPVTLLEVDIRSEYPLDLGANPGSSLRGALYQALGALYDTHEDVQSRTDVWRNPVGWLMRMEDNKTTGGRYPVRPLAIRPPLQNRFTEMTFAVALYGYARQLLPMVLSAVGAMQKIGVGRDRSKFALQGVRALDPLSRQASAVLDAAGRTVGDVPQPLPASAYVHLAKALDPQQLTIQFLTPTRIVQDSKLVKTPEFRPLMQRLLGRVRQISELYTDKALFVPFHDLLGDADSVRITHDDTRWQEGWSGSRRDGQMKPTSGFVGTVSYQGDFTRLLPYILLGQGLQVGKNTMKGCGWYDVQYQWRSSERNPQKTEAE